MPNDFCGFSFWPALRVGRRAGLLSSISRGSPRSGCSPGSRHSSYTRTHQVHQLWS
jgi:hypothetical protein